MLQGPKSGLLSNTWKRIARETCADKARDLTGRRHRGGEQQGKGTREKSAMWIYGDGISFRVVFGQSFWLKSPSWWHAHCSAKMDASNKDSGKWSDMWCLLLTFPELFRLVDLPSRNSSCKWLLWCLARVGAFSQCASPNNMTVRVMSDASLLSPLTPNTEHTVD